MSWAPSRWHGGGARAAQVLPALWTVTLMQCCSPMPVMSSSSSPLLYGWHPSTTIVVPATCYMRLVPCHHRACGSTWHWQILAISEVHTAMACCRHGDMGACLGTQPGGRVQRRNVYAQIEPMHRDRKCKSLFHDFKLVNIEEFVLFFYDTPSVSNYKSFWLFWYICFCYASRYNNISRRIAKWINQKKS